MKEELASQKIPALQINAEKMKSSPADVLINSADYLKPFAKLASTIAIACLATKETLERTEEADASNLKNVQRVKRMRSSDALVAMLSAVADSSRLPIAFSALRVVIASLERSEMKPRMANAFHKILASHVRSRMSSSDRAVAIVDAATDSFQLQHVKRQLRSDVIAILDSSEMKMEIAFQRSNAVLTMKRTRADALTRFAMADLSRLRRAFPRALIAVTAQMDLSGTGVKRANAFQAPAAFQKRQSRKIIIEDYFHAAKEFFFPFP